MHLSLQNGNIVWTETTIVRLNDIFIVSLPSVITIYLPSIGLKELHIDNTHYRIH
jgi:hypothetical protein